MAIGAPNNAFRDPCRDRLYREALLRSVPDIESLHESRLMVKLENNRVGLAAIDARALRQVLGNVALDLLLA
jgi:hypothetical protein